MPDATWWTIDDVLTRVIAGPYLWDGIIPLSLPEGQRAVRTVPPGYSSGSPELEARVTALETRSVGESRGVAQLPAIALLQTLTVKVTLRTPMAGTNYRVTPLLIGLTNGLSIPTPPVVMDRQNVNVPVRASVALSLGAASVLVFADAL